MRISRSLVWLLGILLLGTVLRLVWVYEVNTQPVYDFKRYHDLAMSVLHHGTYEIPEGLDYIKADTPYIKTGVHYPTAFRPPGYPLFLAAIYAVWPNILAAKLVNVALGVVWMAGMYLLGKRFFGEKAGLWAAFITAIFPPAISYTSVISTEILSVALVLVILCIHAYKIGSLWLRSLILGLLTGFLVLVKPYYEVFPVIYFILLWWQQGETKWADWKPRLKKCLLGTVMLAVAMAAVIAPWSVRNYKVLDRFVPISTNGGFVLYINNNDLAAGKYMDALKVPNSIFLTDRILDDQGTYNEADAMKLAGKEAKSWMWHHPRETLFLGITRLALSYSQVGTEIWEWTMSKATLRFDQSWVNPTIQVHRLASTLIVGGGLMYATLILWQFARRRPMNPLHKVNLLFIAFYTAVIFASEGQPRYTFVLFPFLIFGVVWLGTRLTAAMLGDSDGESDAVLD
ncbi:ArnT family glycosyltransferase [Gorillibacterium massiliense]|uniref:ArnT family glycosyltransferase n=1 Tax=Gorillibacterium massiliense TaxID=1280390 RepID=UPI0004B8BBBE|nr:glycosyltransferase family 39 protein [Gorillibacterium massiliense]